MNARLDASSAHRTDATVAIRPTRTHDPKSPEISAARYVSNRLLPPGICLAGAPAHQAGTAGSRHATALRCHRLLGGGRKMIEQFQAMDANTANNLAVQSYGLDQGHKHLK